MTRVQQPAPAEHDLLRIGSVPPPTHTLLAQVDAFIADMRLEEPYVLGFPGNLDFGFSHLAGLLDIFANNVGDPAGHDKSSVGAKAMERAAVEFLAELANGDPAQTYGYIAAGGSEANLFGLDRGATLLPDAAIYCGRSAHDSIRKNARLMRKQLVLVDDDGQGRMDPAALERACRRRRGAGAVVVATIGTTMTGAIDDVDALATAASAAGAVYLHADAALSGLIVPFTDRGPGWGFARREVGSVSISMHKALGMPVACAAALCRTELVESRVHGEYVGATDSTLSCSRSGLAAVLTWYALTAKGRHGLAEAAHSSLRNAEYAARKLAAVGLRPQLHRDSIIVVFDRPAERICRKYHLAIEGERAHIVTVPHVTREIIDELCGDIARTAR